MADGATVTDSGHKADCVVKPYDKLKCDEGSQRHHIVPDYVLRSGSRKAGTRVPGMENMPLSKGPCICLKGNARSNGTEHHLAHKGQDPRIFDAGKSGKFGSGYPKGTAPLSEILAISKEEVGEIKKHCKQEISDALDDHFSEKKGFNPNTPCRTTHDLPEGDALTKLSKTAIDNGTF